MRYAFRWDGRTHHVQLEEHADGARFIVAGQAFTPGVIRTGPGTYEVTVDGESHIFRFEDGLVHDGASPLDLSVQRAKPELVRAGGKGKRGGGQVKPPMPGKVVEIHVKEGQEVAEGDVLIVLEAMKMQNDLKSPVTGKVSKVLVNEGANVEASTILLEVEAAEE